MSGEIYGPQLLLYHRKITMISLEQETGLAPESEWTFGEQKNLLL
jgi:hypothetical protein